MQYSFHNF